jgi:hypothetical protein
MMKSMQFLLVVLLFNEAIAQPIQTTYHINIGVAVNTSNDILTKLVIILPLAQTNQYQTVNNVVLNYGVVADIPESDDKYLRWTITDNLPPRGGSKDVFYTFDVTLHAVNFDFSRITALYPYDTSSKTWKWNTGASGVYVDPDNATVRHIGDSIGSRSSDIVDYARRCYQFVATHYSYLNPNTGIHPLQDILTTGGGDCGNLTSIYVSLLRYKKIPSRHIVTVRPDGTYHVWSDFYLEQYGWVPVDVTYKNSNPSGDYFGKYDGNGIVMIKGVALQLDRGDGFTYIADLLQNFHWWYWCSTAGNSVSCSYRIVSVATATCGIEIATINALSRDGNDDRRVAHCGKPITGIQSPIRWLNLRGQTVTPWLLHQDMVFVKRVKDR